MNQHGIIPPYTYVRNCQTTASQYNNQIMRNMVSYSGGFPQYYTTPHAHAIHALHAQQAAAQYAMYQQQQLTQQYQFYPEVCHQYFHASSFCIQTFQ